MKSAFLLSLAQLFCTFAILANPASLLPQGGTIIDGAANISVNGAEMNIDQLSNRAITEWHSFSIGEQAGVNVNQPTANSAFLARVVGQDPSAILGRLNANGQVYMVNPNGIIFGQNATVSVSALVASTLNISNDNFANGIYQFTGTSDADAAISGTIDAQDFTAVIAQNILVSDAVINTGSMGLVHASSATLIRENIGGGGATIDFTNVQASPTGNVTLANADVIADHLSISSGTTIEGSQLNVKGPLELHAAGDIDLDFGNKWAVIVDAAHSIAGDITLTTPNSLSTTTPPGSAVTVGDIGTVVSVIGDPAAAPPGVTTVGGVTLSDGSVRPPNTYGFEIADASAGSPGWDMITITDSLTIQNDGTINIVGLTPPYGGPAVLSPAGGVTLTAAPTANTDFLATPGSVKLAAGHDIVITAPTADIIKVDQTPPTQQPVHSGGSGGNVTLYDAGASTRQPPATKMPAQVPTMIQVTGSDRVIPTPEPLNLETLISKLAEFANSPSVIKPNRKRQALPSGPLAFDANTPAPKQMSQPFVGPLAPSRNGHGQISIDFNFE